MPGLLHPGGGCVMAFSNYKTQVLRASAVTSGASEQDTAVIVLQTAQGGFFVRVQKTAEANADNLLTVRLQAHVNAADWVDVPHNFSQLLGAVATAADTAADVTRSPNITPDAETRATFTYLAFYEALPSKTVRIASVSSGTAVVNTFEADITYRVV